MRRRVPATILMSCIGLAAASCATPSGAAAVPGPHYPAWEGPLPAPGSLSGPVWLVGLDGASWDLMRPMLERGELPNLAAMIERGAHGTLVSEEPTISPALWATAATGVPRRIHGIDNFTVKAPASHREVPAGPLDRRVPALWDLVGSAGGRAAVVSWFGSYPAEEISGVYLSKGLDPSRPAPGQVHPPEFAATLRQAARLRLPRFAFEEIGRTDFLRARLLEDARTLAAVEAIVSREKPDLFVVYFQGLDVAQHVTWMHWDAEYTPFPGDGPRVPALAGVIPAYYRYVDHVVGELQELAPREATFVVVSDHGAGPLEPRQAIHLQLDVLLRALGFTRTRADDTGTIDAARTVAFTISELYREDKRIWLNLAGVEPHGPVAPADAAATADRIRHRLESLRTRPGDHALFDAVEVHVTEPGWAPGDPALTVRFSEAAFTANVALDGGRELDLSPVRLRHRDVSGGHRLEGILVARGPAVAAGARLPDANLYQMAPTVLYLLGLPQDARMLAHAPREGGVLEPLIRPETLAAHPVRTTSGYAARRAGGGRRSDTAAADPAVDESIETLTALGYIR